MWHWQLQDITTLWPVSNYTSRLWRHIYLNNLSRVIMWSGKAALFYSSVWTHLELYTSSVTWFSVFCLQTMLTFCNRRHDSFVIHHSFGIDQISRGMKVISMTVLSLWHLFWYCFGLCCGVPLQRVTACRVLCEMLCTAIQLLKDKAPGSFVVRNSSSFQGSFGLAVRVAHLPPNVQIKGGSYWPAVTVILWSDNR